MPPDDHDPPAQPDNVDLVDASSLGIDATGIVERDTPCRRCGYNLHGLPRDGECPECGSRVAPSLGDKPLAECDACWLRQIRNAAKRAIVFQILTVIGTVVTPVAVQAFVSKGWRQDELGLLPPLVLVVAPMVVAAHALRQLARRDVTEIPTPQEASASWRLRVASGAVPSLSGSLLAIVGLNRILGDPAEELIPFICVGLLYLLLIALAVSWHSQVRVIEFFARRGPGGWLARTAKELAQGVLICMSVIVGSVTLLLALVIADSPALFGAASFGALFGIPAALIAIAIAIGTAGLYVSFDTELYAAERLARERETQRPARRESDAQAE